MSDPNSDDRPPAERSEALHRPPSEYQRASQAYYEKMRESHTGVYGSKQRIREEQNEKRYTNVTPPKLGGRIRNLGSLIAALHRLCGPGPGVRGVDFGCGSHWFVDFVRNDPHYRWLAVGYDPDAHAVELARRQFPESAEFYRCLDPVREGLPESAGTQDFVFSNAVLQHFDDRETDRAISEISRVLRPGAFCMLVFKCWTEELATGASGMDKAPKVLDRARGKVLFFDPTMKREIDKLLPAERGDLEEHTKEGWRLFHVFRVEEIVEIARRHGLAVTPDVRLDATEPIRGIITYRSGKTMPTACIVLTKKGAIGTAPG